MHRCVCVCVSLRHLGHLWLCEGCRKRKVKLCVWHAVTAAECEIDFLALAKQRRIMCF